MNTLPQRPIVAIQPDHHHAFERAAFHEIENADLVYFAEPEGTVTGHRP